MGIYFLQLFNWNGVQITCGSVNTDMQSIASR